ncbi:metal tolerance protein [Acrasis kona]|uniref:Metal tolerance protein n=1 Tax=Acrasis kona TaxID=1008807 RepID=A0AAW2ZP08_9EUKA
MTQEQRSDLTRLDLLFQTHSSVRLDKSLTNTFGIGLLLTAFVCDTFRKNHARRLGPELKNVKLYGLQVGGRRLMWTSLVFGASIMMPFILFSFMLSPSKIFFEIISPWNNFVLLVLGNFIITIPYYADRISRRANKKNVDVIVPDSESDAKTAPCKSPSIQWRIIITAMCCSTIYFPPTTFALATLLLIKSVGTITGSNILLTNTSIPFITFNNSSKRNNNAPQQRGRFMNGLSMYLQFIMSNKDSRYLFFFLLANLAFMFVELVYGLYSNSLGLISDSAHMFFDAGALAIGLYGSFMSKWSRNNVYTYGYGRYEYLSALINGLLLVFISFYIFIEAFHRIFDPPVIEETGRLILISVIGFCVNLTGMFFFHQDDNDDNHNENMYGVYLHMLADTLGSVGVIISTLLMQYFEWYMADPIASLIISALILGASYPLLTSSSSVLLQRAPRGSDDKIKNCLETIEHWTGVLNVTNTHFWTMDNNTVVGTLHLKVEDSVNEQQMRQKACDALLQVGVNSVTIQIEKSEAGYTLSKN